MKRVMLFIAAAGLAMAMSGTAMAQGTGTGPVATACKKEIVRFCAKAGHGAAQTRTCLQGHRKQLSKACRTALDSTGGGKGRNRMK